MAGKKMAVAPKVQMRPHSLLSAAKGSFLHKEMELPAKDHSQLERSKFREALAAALSMDSDHLQFGQQQSASMSQPNPKRARMSDVHAGVIKPVAPQIGPDQPNRAVTGTDDEATTQEKKVRIQKAQRLAFIIEKRLFELSGGVCNKQYKEKAIALLFKLKDRNDPVPRERVLSGDITPKRLCAMSVDELASEDLSEWRMARAQNRASSVLLPDRQVDDARRSASRTHKGESQVEAEETHHVMEVGLPDISNAGAKSVDKKSVHKEVKESDNSVQDGVPETCSSNTSSDLEHTASNEENDLMQEPMIDDVEVTENLPQIMTLLEFMQVFHSETRSEDQSAGALQDDPSIDKADKAFKSESVPIAKDKDAALKFQFHSDLQSPQDNFESTLESLINKSVSIMDPVLEPKGDVVVKSPHEKVDAEKPDTVNGSIPESAMQCKITPDAVLPRDIIWEGTIQLGGLTSPTNIVAIFKSGDKPSTNEWCRFLEIKRRVTLSVLKEFLEGLANSRNHAIMVTEICSKEGSLESGRHHPLQIIDSYIADGRGVGLVKAAEGVQIYLCPQGKAAKILADHLPKEHSCSLTVTETSIIGLVVWRRPQQARCPQESGRISISVVPWISQPPSRSSSSHQDVVTADDLPGFGPGVVKDDADLPEYNCVSVSNSASNATTSQTNRSQWHTSLSDSEIREMVLKYG